MRGVAALEAELKSDTEDGTTNTDKYKLYDLPYQETLDKFTPFRWIPMCPSFKPLSLTKILRRGKK